VLFNPHSLSEGQKIVRTRNVKFRQFEVLFEVLPTGAPKKLPKRKTEGFASLGCCLRSTRRVDLEKLFKNKTFSFIFKVLFGCPTEALVECVPKNCSNAKRQVSPVLSAFWSAPVGSTPKNCPNAKLKVLPVWGVV
jgi:hypothetical protein